jgi:hypothetical protein
MKLKGSSSFTIIVGLFFIIMIFLAGNFSFGALIFPVGVAVVCLMLTIIQFVSDLKGKTTEGQVYDIAPDRTMAPKLVYQKTAIMFGWLLGLYAGIWLLGFKIGFSIFFVSFLKIDGRCNWVITILLTVVMMGIILAFEHLLGVYWPAGLIEKYVDLPI